ncbi:MAG TPA: M23 family metallopeptidase, partial [Roseiflexaceae bacterium]|nr:M23 family metallopeptidase [Roseiflexaceae bacterium]
APARAALQRAAPAAPPLPTTSAPLAVGLAVRLPAASLAGAWPTAATAPTAAPLASSALSSGGAKARLGQAPDAGGAPNGCPLASDGRVVVTQGYGVGTHAPAESWGALDLGVDRDGDGVAEPESSRGALVFTPQAGVARVVRGSWPGGNYVRVTDARTGWATAYAHLDQVFVSDGQALEAGAPIGTVGSTGYATAPHLHYEVWRDGANLDPSPFVQCG